MLASLTALAALVPALAFVPPTSTTMSISIPESAYGQIVTATASVSATSGVPEGDVVFSVDGVATKANLGASGVATFVLPRATVGQHPVVASFVPQFPERQEASASPTQTWSVAQVRTRLQVRVIGRGVRIPTSVRVGAAGEYGTLPTGRVSMAIRRTASGATTGRTRTLSPSAIAVADFGRLRTGRYRLVVTYAGDTQHLPTNLIVELGALTDEISIERIQRDHRAARVPPDTTAFAPEHDIAEHEAGEPGNRDGSQRRDRAPAVSLRDHE